MHRRIWEAKNEVDALPDTCPWCDDDTAMVSKHAPRAHPKKWQGWKARHEKVVKEVAYWREVDDAGGAPCRK